MAEVAATADPEMERDGYDRDFAAAVNITSATTGLIIPPSNVLIVYSLASGGVSIAALFVAGYLPGLLMGVALMIVAAGYVKKYNLPRGERIGIREAARRTVAAVPSLLLVGIVIGGILGGIFTATEAGGIAVVYSLMLAMGVYREVRIEDLAGILVKAAETTAIVMFLIAVSIAMSWLLAYENVPAMLSEALLTISDNPLVLLLLINLLLLMIGVFMDMTPAVLIFTPIFLPVALELGMSPLHFGIMLIMNLTIGLCTPPVGSILFVSCAVANTSIGRIVRPMIPMYLALIASLLLVTYVPAISEALPRLFGLID